MSDFYTAEAFTKTKADPQILVIDLKTDAVAATPARKLCKQAAGGAGNDA